MVVGEPEPPRQELADQECTTTSEPETYYSICITTSQGIDAMNRDELVSQIRFLLKLQEDKDAIIDRQQVSLDEMKADLKEARKDNKALQFADILASSVYFMLLSKRSGNKLNSYEQYIEILLQDIANNGQYWEI